MPEQNLTAQYQKPECSRGSAVDKILLSAKALFSEKSFEAVSVQDIALHAGVSKANVFHHFRNKDALILAVLQTISLPHAEYLENLLAKPVSSLSKIRTMIEFEVGVLTENPKLLRLIGLYIRRNQDDHTYCEARKVISRNGAARVALFRQGQETGEFRKDFPCFIPAMLTDGLNHIIALDPVILQLFQNPAASGANETGTNTDNPTNWKAFAEDIFKFISPSLLAAESPQGIT